MPDFTQRSRLPEIMDDLAVSGAEVDDTLRAIRRVNRYLGGHRTGRLGLKPFLRKPPDVLNIIDLGAGLADHAVDLVQWAARRGCELRITAVDANPAIVELARLHVARTLDPVHADRISLVHADARELPFPDRSFDISMASLFLHHFDDREAARLLAEMARVSKSALIVNDLHRHRLAWELFRLMCRVLPAPDMFRDDGLLSIRKGFRRNELRAVVRSAGLPDPEVAWAWAFRWCATIRLGRPS